MWLADEIRFPEQCIPSTNKHIMSNSGAHLPTKELLGVPDLNSQMLLVADDVHFLEV